MALYRQVQNKISSGIDPCRRAGLHVRDCGGNWVKVHYKLRPSRVHRFARPNHTTNPSRFGVFPVVVHQLLGLYNLAFG